MKFSFTPNLWSNRELLSDDKRTSVRMNTEKKWNSYVKEVDVYRADKQHYLNQAESHGKLQQAHAMLKKMEADPTVEDSKAFLAQSPSWPERHYSGPYERIEFYHLPYHSDSFGHLNADAGAFRNLDNAINGMHSSVRPVKDSAIKSLFGKTKSAVQEGDWVYQVAPRDEKIGALAVFSATAWMAAHKFNALAEEHNVWMRVRIESKPSDRSIWEYVFLYPEDNAERHIWREVFHGIPRPAGSLLPPPFVADIPRPPPYGSAPVSSSDKLKQLIETKNMLKLHGADDETLAVVTNQIAKLAIGATDQSQQASRSRIKAIDQNFV
jgi:hypothetical protein